MEEKVGLIRSFIRWITFYKWRKALAVARSADAQFTSSAAGISDAYDLEHEKLLADFRDFMGAVTAVETAVEGKRARLETLEGELKTEREALEGALAVYNNDALPQERRDEAKEDGSKFQANVTRLEGEIDTLEDDIEKQEEEIAKLEKQLTAMKEEIARLPQEKAGAIADFVSDTKLIEAYERLNGLKSRMDRGPLDAVQAKRQELRAKARVTGRVVGAATRDKAAEYRDAAKKDASGDSFERMAAARKAAKETATGDGASDKKDNERPQI